MRALVALLAFVVIMTAKIWIVQSVALGGAKYAALGLDALFMFAIFSAVDLAFADLRIRWFLVVDTVVSALLAALIVYHAYYGLLPSRGSLAAIGQAAAVGGGIMSLLNPVLLLLFIDVPLIAAWVVRSRRRGIDPLTGHAPGTAVVPGFRTPYVYQARRVYFVAAAVAVLLVVSVRTTAESSDARDTRFIASTRGLGSYIAVALWDPQSNDSSLAQALGAQPSAVQRRINKLAHNADGAPRPGFTSGQASGANVIIVQVEALQAIAVGHKVDGQSVTPNLDALAKDSWYFPNCVSGAGVGTTADVEFVTNTSLYPPSDVGASLGWSDRELTSMPRVLNAQGYESYTFHTNTAGFWNRSQFYPALGFTRYFDKSYFGTADKMAFDSASDHVLFEKTLPRLEEAASASKPFYAQIITMSSHFPFKNVPADRRKLHVSAPYKGTITGDYLTEVNYTDEQIGYFVDELKQSGLWDKSIVVVYGDHFGLPEPTNDAEAAATRALAGHDYNKADRLLVPLIIHLPGQKSGTRVQAPVGQVDLAPTLADAMGVELSGMAHFGRSILRNGDGVIAAGGLLGQGAYADGSLFSIPGVTSDRDQVFDIRTREESTKAASAAKFSDVKQLVDLSRQYVGSLPKRQDFNPNAEITFPRRK